MNCRLTRSQKARANARQKDLLNVLAEYNQLEQKYGVYYMILQFYNKLYDLGIEPFESVEDKNATLFALKLGEAIRILQGYRKQQVTDSHIEYEYNTANLYIGQVVANYRELCLLVGAKILGGKQKKEQLKDFLRYFDFEKLQYSNEYVILDIYDEPIKKNEQAKNSLYCNALKLIIMYEVSKELTAEKAKNKYPTDDDIVYSIETTYSKLIGKLELLSIFFDKEITDFLIDKYIELTNQDITDINKKDIERTLTIFKRVLHRKHKGNVDYALKRLKDQNIIHYDSYSVIYENGKKRQATFEEEVLIENAKREAAKTVGCKNANIASLYKQEKYNQALEAIYQNKYKWLYVFNQIKIGSNYKMLNTPINEYTNYSNLNFSILDLSHSDLNRYKRIYLNNVCDSSLKSAEKKNTESKEKLLSGFDDFEKDYNVTPDRFINEIDNELIFQKLLIDCIVNPDEEAIAEYNNYYDS